MKSSSQKETEKIINSAYKSLEEFCLNSCNGICCKDGVLRLSENEAKKIFNKNLVVKKSKDLFVVSTHPICIHLNKNNQCKIYNKRPSICREYPIKLIKGSPNIIIFHPSCKAIQNGPLDSQISSLRNLGNIVMT
jgi:Fe-S-cluster containining protein